MDDRFDLMFVTEEMLDDTGLDYITDSYRVFGNNGTHTLNSTVDTGTGAASNVLKALASASDHLLALFENSPFYGIHARKVCV